MKQRFILLLALALANCRGNEILEQDLEGNTYSVQLQLDSAMANDAMTARMLTLAKIEYRFNNNHKGVYQAEFGSRLIERPLSWRIEKDSLVLVVSEQGPSRPQWYGLSAIEGGYLIDNKLAKLKLIKQ